MQSQEKQVLTGETKLDKWVSHLSQRELPIFKYSLIAITEITARENSSNNELSSAILKDVNLTARILRLSNSYIYNPSNTHVHTVTHATMLLGFNLVRDISISLAIIDTLLKGNKETHIMKLMARTFHAAVQARAIAEAMHDESPEEIFIAALLHNIGELTFCCVDSQSSEKLVNSRLISTDEDYLRIQKETLGFTFNELTSKLTEDWQLSDLLHDTLVQTDKPKTRCKHILFGNSIAAAAEHGWKSPETDKEFKALSKHLNLSIEETTKFIHDNVEEAVNVAQEFGARAAAEFIPSLEKTRTDKGVPIELEEQEVFLMPDHMLQLSILRDLSGILNKNPALNQILTMVLEGIYRGIGMDRAVLALVNPQKTETRAKIALGKNSSTFEKEFVFNIDMQKPNLLQQMLIYNRSYWIKDDEEGQQLVGKTMRNTLHTKTFFIAPITVENKTVGIFYADRQPSARILDDESFSSFKHFVQEACIALKFITKK